VFREAKKKIRSPDGERIFFFTTKRARERKILIFLSRASAGSKLCLRNYERRFAALRFFVFLTAFFAALRFFAMVVANYVADMSTRLCIDFRAQTFLCIIIAHT
jgi:hypothetical protein